MAIAIDQSYTQPQGPLSSGAINTGGSLFNPQGPLQSGAQLSTPVSTPEDDAIDAFMRQNGINDIVQGRAAYYSSQQPGVTEQMPSIMNPSPVLQSNPLSAGSMGEQVQQQLNTPSFSDIAQTQPFQLTQQQVPVTTQPPETQAAVQQIQAPTTGAPTTSVPLVNAQPETSQLIQQIKAPTAPKAPAPPPMNTQQFAQQFRPAPVPQAKPQPIMARPAPVMAKPQPRPVMAQRPMATSVSRVNPPLLPARPMTRR